MSLRRVAAAALAAAALALCCTACDDRSSAPTGADELSRVRTTLDAIDSEVAGDGSP
ncbi:hypothetical protein [Amycolatopsis acidicola]|uniref:hypothetical protein n=1 Tax=Amycolatopsis acidicola TaxID=2596893 RepID=UPI00140DF0EB|nr:hypothetical protein [Amycolatopsis acidicola]